MAYRFTIVIPNVDDDKFDAIAGGCPDSMSGIAEGRAYVDFSREGGSLGSAIDTAIRDLSKLGVTPLGVRVDELAGIDGWDKR